MTLPETIEELELKPIKELLNEFGGWPVTTNDWNNESWSWQKTVKDLETIGFQSNFLFELSVGANQKNTSSRILGVKYFKFISRSCFDELNFKRLINRRWDLAENI